MEVEFNDFYHCIATLDYFYWCVIHNDLFTVDSRHMHMTNLDSFCVPCPFLNLPSILLFLHNFDDLIHFILSLTLVSQLLLLIFDKLFSHHDISWILINIIFSLKTAMILYTNCFSFKWLAFPFLSCPHIISDVFTDD